MSTIATRDLAERFEEFFRNYYRDDVGRLAQHYPRDQCSLYIEFDDLFTFDADLADDWLAQPETMQEYAEQGLQLVDLPADISLANAHVRLTDTREAMETTGVGRLDSESLGEFVAVRGQLSKVTGVGYRIREAAWECQRCGVMAHIPQGRTSVQEPHECQGCERQGPFKLHVGDSEIADQRKLKLEQTPDEQAGGGGGESVVVYVDDDLCWYGGENGLADRAGERVTVLGVHRLNEADVQGRGADPEAGAWLEGQAITFEADDYDDVDVDAHREAFEALAEREDCIEQLAASIAPEIKADDDLETFLEAAVAWLFNAYRVDPDGDGQFRGDLHMGLISDPGQGKSTILSQLAQLAPRCEFRSGTGLSAVGLTAAAVQEEFAGKSEWTLEPGVLPRANGGHCIIDEVDDVVDEKTKKMHDALEGDQMVKIDKAGMSANLPTRTALLASGNPREGRFDDYSTQMDQIDLDPALISRMDLLFAMRDVPDPEWDGDVAQHILDSYDELSREEISEKGLIDDPGEQTTTERPVSQDVFRAMLVYAREHVFPLLTQPAKEMLRDYYVEVRGLNEGADDPIPATARTLEAGIRIATAFARAELSETVEPRHAERAIRISRQVVGLNFDPATGKFDAGMTDEGVPTSQKERKRAIKAALNGADEVTPAEVASEVGIDEGVAREELEGMAERGEVVRPQQGVFRSV